ncbi:MAG: hypothetical protein QMD85_03570 [Candidatus Aenigmarchaeota archaeon]|nr:hypothetical protein [Candidatus Aenigmarchaeota archaeon]MDI6722631.1 hypothetical protein [Candidatus Aenigmarchaeota archaeon]
MKLKTINEKQNVFFGRKEVELEIEHETAATPSKAALQQYIANENKKEAECIEIMSIISSKGSNISKSLVYIWDQKKTDELKKQG